MQTFLNVGVDVAKDAVVVACAEHSFPVQSVPNQRPPCGLGSNRSPPVAASA